VSQQSACVPTNHKTTKRITAVSKITAKCVKLFDFT